MGYVSAGAVHEEADHLLEDLSDGNPLSALSQRAEQTLQVGLDVDTAKIPNQQRQSSTAGQRVLSNIDVVNAGLEVGEISSMIMHDFLPPNGLTALPTPIVGLACCSNTLTHSVGFFMP